MYPGVYDYYNKDSGSTKHTICDLVVVGIEVLVTPITHDQDTG